MIAPELVNELQGLKPEEKLAVIRLLQRDLDDEPSEWERLTQGQRKFRFIPPIRIKPEASAEFLRMLEEESLLDT